MFFDRKQPTDDLRVRLIALAGKQGELYRAFMRGENIQDDILHLEAMRDEIRNLKQQTGDWYGLAWWNLTWEQLVSKLTWDTSLSKPSTGKDWEWECELQCEEKDGHGLLYLMYHGRKYGVRVDRDEWNTEKVSKYSVAEQAEMVSKMNKDINRFEFWNAITSKGEVQSALTGQNYSSMASYYMSLEHMVTRKWISDDYARSLYTEHTTHTMAVSSANIHIRHLFEVAMIHVSEEGMLDMIKPGSYHCLTEEQKFASYFKEGLWDKDPIVLSAKFLADYDRVKKIPVTLFCKEIDTNASTLEAAMRQAEIFTCLAEKIC